MLMANYLQKEHNKRINNFFHALDLFHWVKNLKKYWALRFSQVPCVHSARASQVALGSPVRTPTSRRPRIAYLREWQRAYRAWKIILKLKI
jgi:hypothetical protein